MYAYWIIIAIAIVGCLINPSMGAILGVGLGITLGAVLMLLGNK